MMSNGTQGESTTNEELEHWKSLFTSSNIASAIFGNGQIISCEKEIQIDERTTYKSNYQDAVDKVIDTMRQYGLGLQWRSNSKKHDWLFDYWGENQKILKFSKHSKQDKERNKITYWIEIEKIYLPKKRETLCKTQLDVAGHMTISCKTNVLLGRKGEAMCQNILQNDKQSRTEYIEKMEELGGITIDFDYGINSDDRSYMNLSKFDDRDQLDTLTNEQRILIRLLYHASVHLGISDEILSIPDVESDQYNWNTGQKDEQGFTIPERLTENKNFHLFPSEASVIYGGNLVKDGNNEDVTDPRAKKNEIKHQMAHTDCINLQSLQKFKERTKTDHGLELEYGPMSLILPLSQEGRSIYVDTQKNKIDIPFNTYFIFDGSKIHGGVTEICQDNESTAAKVLRPAIHMHIDSKHHERRSGEVDIITDIWQMHIDHLCEVEPLLLVRHLKDCWDRIKVVAPNIIVAVQDKKKDQSRTSETRNDLLDIAQETSLLIQKTCAKSLGSETRATMNDDMEEEIQDGVTKVVNSICSCVESIQDCEKDESDQKTKKIISQMKEDITEMGNILKDFLPKEQKENIETALTRPRKIKEFTSAKRKKRRASSSSLSKKQASKGKKKKKKTIMKTARKKGRTQKQQSFPFIPNNNIPAVASRNDIERPGSAPEVIELNDSSSDESSIVIEETRTRRVSMAARLKPAPKSAVESESEEIEWSDESENEFDG